MHPKTFLISLRRPLRQHYSMPYVFHLHAETREAALEWVAQTFPGVDTETTRQRWMEPPRETPRVGNDDPVAIQDCDRPFRRIRVRGGWTTEPVAEGTYRRSEADVAADLFKIFGNLQAERQELERSFAHLTKCYTRSGREWERERIVDICEALDRALIWQDNVWAEYRRMEARKIFEAPEVAALSA